MQEWIGTGVPGKGTGMDRDPGCPEGGLIHRWVLAIMCLPEEPEVANPADLLHSFINSRGIY